MHIGNYLGLLHESEKNLAKAFRMVADEHGDEPDVYQTCLLLASWSERHLEDLRPLIEKYQEKKNKEPDRLNRVLFEKPRTGSLALLRDLHDLWLMANEVQLCWVILMQAADALKDREFKSVAESLSSDTKRQVSWLLTRIKQAAPQTLIVAE